MASILVIEDETDIQDILRAFLEDAGYQVVTAGDGVTGLNTFMSGSFDLVLLDIMLPKIDGYAVCEMIRKVSNVPVIMLTALDEEADEMRGFELSVDDYIGKPFSIGLVLKRIEAVLRRINPAAESAGVGAGGGGKTLEYKDMILDLEGYRVLVGDRQIALTSREFEILRLLLENRGRVITRENLLNRIWDYDYFGDERIINTHIKNIRRKTGENYIETVRGVGYKIN